MEFINRLAQGPTLRDAVEKMSRSMPRGNEGMGNAKYRRFGRGPLDEFGLKIRHGDPNYLMSTVSTLAIHHDPLADLNVGQQVAWFEVDTDEKPRNTDIATLTRHTHGQHPRDLIKKTSLIGALRGESEEVRILRILQKINSFDDRHIKEWLETLKTLNERGFAVDTTAHNLLLEVDGLHKGLHWIDPDDPRISSLETNDTHKTLRQLRRALRIPVVSRQAQQSGAISDSNIQIEWDRFIQRVNEIAEEVGVPHQLDQDSPKSWVQRYEYEVKERISIDEPISKVEQLLKDRAKKDLQLITKDRPR